MVRRNKNSVEFIYCACGCGKTRPKYRKDGRERHFIKGHVWKGKSFSEEHIMKLCQVRKGIQDGNRNPFWKGDNVGISALHNWMRLHFQPPKTCQNCNE